MCKLGAQMLVEHIKNPAFQESGGEWSCKIAYAIG